MKWTPSQLAAITARNRTILVSAAAGSGKTAVLVERILSLVREGYRLDRMLVCTFTRAAAAEMRQRLRSRLYAELAEDPRLFGQALDDLELAQISTIHAFCQRVVRTQFQAVGVDPAARVATDAESAALFEEAWRAAMNELLEENDPEFRDFATVWTMDEARQMTLVLHRFLLSLPDPWGWLDSFAGRPEPDDLEQEATWRLSVHRAMMGMADVRRGLTAERAALDDADAMPQLIQTVDGDEADTAPLFEAAAAQDTGNFIRLAGEISLRRAVSVRGAEEAQRAWRKDRFGKARDSLKAALEDVAEGVRPPTERALEDVRITRRRLRQLARLTRRTADIFLDLKREERLFDFADMEQFTVQILRDDAICEQFAASFDHIFVDECQDNSRVQDEIIRRLHTGDNCLFLVGDVKQSIYRFRQADPTLFLQRMRTWSRAEDAEERAIFLQENFRSAAAVLDAANAVFERAMVRSVTELDYLPEDRLNHGREDDGGGACEVLLIRAEENTRKGARLEGEAAAVIDRIHSLVAGGSFRYRDMAVLLSEARSTGPALAELFAAAGIPVFFDGRTTYYDLPEVRSFRLLLQAMQDPLQDIPLLGVMKLPCFAFTDRELAAIRLQDSGRDVPFHRAVRAYRTDGPDPALRARVQALDDFFREQRFLLEALPLSDWMWKLLDWTGLYAEAGAMPRGGARQANLRMLIAKAIEFEQRSPAGLAGFLEQVDSEMATGDESGAKELGEAEDLVRIMTMHKSKGLEFPVVFLMCTADPLEKAGAQLLRVHRDLGLAADYRNRALSVVRPTVDTAGFAHAAELDSRAERCRLLYVAMTRARERLVVVGAPEADAGSVWRMPPGPERVWAADSMLDWVMQAASDEAAQALFDVRWLPAGTVDRPTRGEAGAEIRRLLRKLRVQPDPRTDVLSWWDEKPAPQRWRPVKLSVTGLIRHEANDPFAAQAVEETEAEKRLPMAEDGLPPILRGELDPLPGFLQEKTVPVSGAARGTLMHRLLCVAPYDTLRGLPDGRVEPALAALLRELVSKSVFTEEEAALISVRQCADFFVSPVGRRALAAEEVRREWTFNLVLDRRERSVLQGVIDLAFRVEEGWVLCDYKTDRVRDVDAFIRGHRPQLSWYAEALERLTGVPVVELWLFSLSLGEAFPVEREKVHITNG